MRILVLVLASLLWSGVAVAADADHPSGTIELAHGQSVKFSKFAHYLAYRANHQYCRIVSYMGSDRDIPVSAMASMKVAEWSKERGVISIEITTKTGIAARLVHGCIGLVVELFDPLTGEVRTQEYKFWTREGLNIKRVVFNTGKSSSAPSPSRVLLASTSDRSGSADEPKSWVDGALDKGIDLVTPESEGATREMQRKAVKFLLDPNAERSDEHLDGMMDAARDAASGE